MAKYYTPTKLSENIRETPEGYLLCLGVPIARTGWQEYGEGETPLEAGDDGKVHVYRKSEEVFRPQTIASFEGKSVTIKHPADFVSPENWSFLSKGILQNIRRGKELDEDGEECLIADLLITDKFAINLVKNGLREVSCGYEAEYEQTEVGKGLQTNIVGNHLALVEQGRAGSTYAINDEKGRVTMSANVIEKLKKKFGAKAVDEAMAEEGKAKDAMGYDELMKAVKDLGEKMERVEGLVAQGKVDDEEEEEKKKPKDEEEKPAPKKKEEPKAKDEEESEDEDESMDEGDKLEERLKSLEAAVAKLLEKEAKEHGEDEEEEESKDEDAEDEESEMSGDEEEDEEEEGEEGETSQKVGDAARAEILSPGIKQSKNLKVDALKSAYQTKDGKKVIDALTGGKPDFKSKEKVEHLFIAASEVMKARAKTLAGTKNGKAFDSSESNKNEEMTAEKMNEINAALWARK